MSNAKPNSIKNLLKILPILWLISVVSNAWALSDSSNGPFSTRRSLPSSTPKIFLVAGSSQNANFAQEVIDQRKLWLARGYPENEIACYYVIPTRREFAEDREQFLSLIPDLASCYPASVKLLREHLILASLGPPKDFLYLYVTSHGQRPISLRLQDVRSGDSDLRRLRKLAKYPVLDQYHLSVEGLPEGPAGERDILNAYRDGKDPRDLYFTPAYLRDLLDYHFAAVPKFIVLQGCFSGGFIGENHRPYVNQTLATVPRLTVLTASRFDRASFGCASGDETTYFGGEYNQVFANRLRHPPSMDWKELYEEVRERVSRLESAGEELDPSLPGFFSNYVSPEV